MRSYANIKSVYVKSSMGRAFPIFQRSTSGGKLNVEVKFQGVYRMHNQMYMTKDKDPRKPRRKGGKRTEIIYPGILIHTK